MNRTSDVIWILVNCNSVEEATRIGDAALAAREATCFDVFPRVLSRYFWPPRSGKVEEARGALLVVETFEDRMERVRALVRRHHADTLPFTGSLRVGHVADEYRSWMSGEIGTEDLG